MSIRVLVVDDQAMFREALVVLLDTAEDITVVGEAADGRQAVDRSRDLSPDVVVMDVRMPGTDGIQATERILAAHPADEPREDQSRVLVLTTFDLDEHVYAALRAGASGFLLKDASRDELLHAVRVVASGQAILAPTVTRRLVTTFAQHEPRPSARGDSPLTSRETEVLALIAEGLSNAEIADRLVVTTETVKTHVSRILNKLALRDRTQAAVYAWEQRLVGPP